MSQPIPLNESVTKSHRDSPSVDAHQVTFQFRLVSLNGVAITEDTSGYKQMDQADEQARRELPRCIPDWTFKDHDNIEGERLELYQPEYADDESLPGAQLYDISVGSSVELPLRRADALADRPLSVEALIGTMPEALIRIYANAGVQMELHKVSFYKRYHYSTSGEYLR